ncbi:MAG: hypothetical protein ACW99G_02640 [Candidatus Thorarchaeota archaeon]|jgi:hypothetical protein
MGIRHDTFVPTPEQIEARSAEVRKKWDDKDFEKRFHGKKTVAWSIPVIDELDLDFDD